MLMLGLLAAACSGRVTAPSGTVDAMGDAAVADTGSDLGPYSGDAWWLSWDAPTFDAPPSVGMYPPNGAGPCTITGCAVSSSQCFSASGWCCEGHPGEGGPFPCSCGLGLGCLPPEVCCTRGDDARRTCGAAGSCR